MARRNTQQTTNEGPLATSNATEGSFMNNNQYLLLGALAVILLLVGAYMAYKYMYLEPLEKEAMEQIYTAEKQFEQDSFARALTNPGGGFDGFLDIIDNYGGTKAANLANYYAGISYLNLGKYDAAIEYLNDFDNAGEILPITKYGALGDAYAEKGDMDAAISNYKKAANMKGNDLLTPYYLKKWALASQRNGDNETALEAFQKIKDEYPTSSEGASIDKYITRLQ